MKLNTLLLISALSLSSVAAYFSIAGLGIMFPGAIGSVVLMALVLEISKIVSAVWTHKNWKIISWFSKSYLTFAIVVLMGITSMGIFGFLSKAHIEHRVSTDEITAQISQIESKIKREEDSIERQKEFIRKAESSSSSSDNKSDVNIEREEAKINSIYSRLEKDMKIDNDKISSLNSRLSELDQALNDLKASSGGLFSNKKKKIEELELSQSVERSEIRDKIKILESNVEKYRQNADSQVEDIRKKINDYQDQSYSADDSVNSEIESYNEKIKAIYLTIDDLNSKKFELSNSERSLEAEVGPVKYVAELINDTSGKEVDLEEAVRWIIIIIIFVFDPLAIMMVICATSQLSKLQGSIQKKK